MCKTTTENARSLFLSACFLILLLITRTKATNPTASIDQSSKRQDYDNNGTLSYCDVLVYDATPSGIAAGIAAVETLLLSSEKHHPRRVVCLLSPTPHLGGMVAGGLGQSDVGWDPLETIGGLGLAFFERVASIYRERSIVQPRAPWNVEPSVATRVFREMLANATQPGKHGVSLEVLEDAGHVAGVEWSSEKTLLSGITTTRGQKVGASVFVDASYEGDLMALAGVPFEIGRESRDRYGESFAGNLGRNDGHQFPVDVDPYATKSKKHPLPYLVTTETPGAVGSSDGKVQSYNFRLCVTNVTGNRVPFPEPASYDPERWELLRRYAKKLQQEGLEEEYLGLDGGVLGLGPLANGKFDANNRGPISTDFVGGSYAYPGATHGEREAIWEAHRQYTLELFWFLGHDSSVPAALRGEVTQNWGLCADEFVDTGHWPPQLYVREARRMVGTEVFTQVSIDQQRWRRNHRPQLANSIGLGCYNYDSHTAQRFPGNNGTRNEGDLQRSPGPMYQIPHWVVLPPPGVVENLAVSVCASASHVAYSTLRMEPQLMALGQAAGVMAAMSVVSGSSLQDTNTTLLRQHLLAMHQILDRPGATATSEVE